MSSSEGRRRRRGRGGISQGADPEGDGGDQAEGISAGRRVRAKGSIGKGSKLTDREAVRSARLEQELFGAPAWNDEDEHIPGESDDDAGDADWDREDGDDLGFVIDAEPASETAAEPASETAAAEEDEDAGDEGAVRRPAWVDEADDDVAVNIASVARRRKLRERVDEDVIPGGAFGARLRARYQQLNSAGGALAWAALPSTSGAPSESEGAARLLGRAGALTSRRPRTLPSGEIAATRARDANADAASKCVIQSVEFSPAARMGQPLLMFTAGLDRRLRLFRVDASAGALAGPGGDLSRSGVSSGGAAAAEGGVRTALFGDLPIRRAAFLDTLGRSILVAGSRPFCYTIDVETFRAQRFHPRKRSAQGAREAGGGGGGGGLADFCVSQGLGAVAFYGGAGSEVTVASTATGQAMARVHVDGGASAGCFASDKELVLCSRQGEVLRFDLRTWRVRDRFRDEGTARCTACAHSEAAGGVLAVGSVEGVVNLYQGGAGGGIGGGIGGGGGGLGPMLARARVPAKALYNLTTKADVMRFNAQGTVLAMGSTMQRDALRLVHVPSRTVFANWPTSKTPLHYVHCVAFSPDSGYLAIGNARGRVLLYKLQHYSN